MEKHPNPRTATLAAIPVLLACGAGAYWLHGLAAPLAARPNALPAPLTTPSVSVLITENVTASTNTPAAVFSIDTNGNGTLSYVIRNDRDTANGYRDYSATLDVTQLKRDLTGLSDASAIASGSCGKSVSFGTVTTITYQGKTSEDISCNPAQSVGAVIYQDLLTLTTQVKAPSA